VIYNSTFFKTNTLFLFILMSILGFSSTLTAKENSTDKAVKKVVIETSFGNITVQLYPKKAPKTVANFINYVKENFYSNTIFHRVIPGFMIQGGGFTTSMKQKKTRSPITNEANNGLHNTVGTLAMARTSNPNSATSQFFINTVNNSFLDQSSSSYGYAVFGKVVKGMNIVHKIEFSATETKDGMRDVPVKPIIIKSIKIIH